MATCSGTPEYYNIDEWDDNERTPSQGQAEFIVAKHRNGGLDSIRMKFIPHLGKFEDLETFDTPFEFQSKMNPNSNERIESGNSKDSDDFDSEFGDNNPDKLSPF